MKFIPGCIITDKREPDLGWIGFCSYNMSEASSMWMCDIFYPKSGALYAIRICDPKLAREHLVTEHQLKKLFIGTVIHE